jgi:hypothetical protein
VSTSPARGRRALGTMRLSAPARSGATWSAVTFDARGVPTWIGAGARALGAMWGGAAFWSAVGRRLCELDGGPLLVLSLHVADGGGAGDRILGTLVGVREHSGRISSVLSVLCAGAGPAQDGAASRGSEETMGEGVTMELKDIVHQLTDLIWRREQQSQQAVETAVLSYIQDAVTVEIEYRRRMHDLDRRLSELEAVRGAAIPS